MNNKLWVVAAILGVVVLSAGFFQNCSKSPNLADYTGASTAAATSCLSPSSLSWGAGCTDAIAVATYQIGQQIQVTAALPYVGSASFTCGTDGNFTADAGAACTAPSTSANACLEPATFSWTVNGITCKAPGGGSIANNTSLPVAATTNSGSAVYTCSNSQLGAPTGTTCTAAPTITAQPAGVTGCAGTTLTLAVTATAASAITYQWYQGGVAISGATAATYTSTIVQGTSTYYVVATDASGSTTSSTATVVGGNPATAGACPVLASQIKACTVGAAAYPVGAGFLLSAINIGDICCEVSPSFAGQTGNGFGLYCSDAPTFKAAAASGPAAPIPGGTSCSVSAAGYPPGSGIISYTSTGVEGCCTIAQNYPHPATAATVGLYCEATATKTGAQTKPPLVNAGAACNVKHAGYAAARGITLYTEYSERICCEIGDAYNGPGDAKGIYCEPY